MSRRSHNLAGSWYALRRTLPPHALAANLAELVEYLPRYGVDELIIMVDVEELSHGLTPMAWLKRYQPRLLQIKSALTSIGIAYSLNPWVTHGHTDRARNPRSTLPGVSHIVGHDGSVSWGCACSLDPQWRHWMERSWTIYAETEPRVMWVEDDIRLFNHGPVRYGCFCELHIKQFCEVIGQTISREQLVEALLQPGEPHPWRRTWLELQGRNMVEVAGLLGSTVHRVSPLTHLGLMSSGPRAHCLEGRRWREFCAALGGGQPIYSRAPLGNYDEQSLRGLFFSHDSIKLTRHVTPPGTIEQTEVENVPFSHYADSTAFTFLKMAVSAAYGSSGLTLNLFDHLGTPMQDDAPVGAMLAARKPMLNGLAQVATLPGRLRGVQMLHFDQFSEHKHLSCGDGYAQLIADGYEMMQLLEALGVATTYDPSDVTATSGQVLGCLTDRQLLDLLSGAVLLDGAAAGVVAQRGFGHLIGIEQFDGLKAFDDPAIGPISAEAIEYPDFGGGEHVYITAQLPDIGHDVRGAGRIACVELSPEVAVVSQLIDPDLMRRRPCMYTCENARGGRIAVTLWDLSTAFGVAMLNPRRAAMMQQAIRWLGRGNVDVIASGGAYPLALRRDLDAQPTTLLGLFNLSLDPWPHATWTLSDPRGIVSLSMLRADGQWVTDSSLSATRDAEHHTVHAARRVPYDDPLFVKLTWR